MRIAGRRSMAPSPPPTPLLDKSKTTEHVYPLEELSNLCRVCSMLTRSRTGDRWKGTWPKGSRFCVVKWNTAIFVGYMGMCLCGLIDILPGWSRNYFITICLSSVQPSPCGGEEKVKKVQRQEVQILQFECGCVQSLPVWELWLLGCTDGELFFN